MEIKEVKTLINSRFEVPVVEGKDKVCSLDEAIKKNVKAGMTIHSIGRTGALNYQLVREFWGKRPNFTFVSYAVSGTLLSLVYGELVKKVITSFAGNSYPGPGPNPLVQKAYVSGSVEFENWTMLTIPQMLLAGAMGWDFIPTKSIIGSSMEEENKEAFKVVDSPFSSNEKIGLVRALSPDITLVHGVAADRCGNTILTYPLGNDVFGAWAAKSGVIVSVEKIVSTEYIRKNSHLVRVPSYQVLAVCEAPYGAHPMGMTSQGLPDFRAYADDYDAMTEVNEASKDEERYSNWIRHWILDCKDHKEYLSKLGKKRLNHLAARANADAWWNDAMSIIGTVDLAKEPNPVEKMVIAASRMIAQRCVEQKLQTIMTGLGLPNLAAWLATYELKSRGHDVDLMAEAGMYGYLPRPADPFIFSFYNMPTSKILTNVEVALGVLAGGSTNRCIGVLGAAQADKFGNVNMTKIPGKFYLVGSGGANDIANGATETVTVVTSGKSRLLNNVPYITYPGKKVRTLISDIGIFEKIGNDESLTLTAYIPSRTNQTEHDAMAEIKEKVGWELKLAPNLNRVQPPTEEELALLRLFDPKGYFIGTQGIS